MGKGNWSLGLIASFFCLVLSGPARGDPFTETYYFTTGGIAESGTPGNAFKDRSPGPDLLPYTADDEDLPPNGNVGGTWTFAALDSDGDGNADRLFSCTRREDDDTYTLSSYSDFAHGVIAEGEDWIDLHDAHNEGPSGDGSKGDLGDDFEWNDRPNWESQSNWFWYNNAAANQRGMGGSRYYFQLENGVFEEVQGWVKMVNFQTNADDPETPFNEKGNSYVRGSNVVLKGLMIPVEAIPRLKDGELDPLFGWYKGDMARYIRDDLGPKLEDQNLTTFLTDEGGNACGRTRSLLPPTYLMIEQGEFQVEIMTQQPDAFARAAYWGIEPVSEGSAETGSVLRWSRIMVKGDDESYEDDGAWNPPIDLVPADGSRENLWVREKFIRQGITKFDPFSGTGTGLPDSWGALQLGCGIPVPDPDNTPPDNCWYFNRRNDEAGIPAYEDCQEDYELTLPAGSGPGASWFALPAGQPLDAAKGKVRAVVDVRAHELIADKNRIQIILTTTGAGGPPGSVRPVAWADIRHRGIAKAGVGGDPLGTGGEVSNGQPLVEQGSAALAFTEGSFTRFELTFDAAARRVTLRSDGSELISGSYAGNPGSVVDGVRFWTESGAGIENQIYVNEVSLLQEFPRPFTRGESNCDGSIDLSDAVTTLNYLFTGGPAPCCLAAANANGDGDLDLSDPVTVLNYLFIGGSTPAAPFVACGVDWETNLGCERFPTCQN